MAAWVDAYIGRLEPNGLQDQEERVGLAQQLEETRGLLNALTLKSREKLGSLIAQVDSLKANLKGKDEDIDNLETDLVRMPEWGDKYNKRYSHEKSIGEKYFQSEQGKEKLTANERGPWRCLWAPPPSRTSLSNMEKEP